MMSTVVTGLAGVAAIRTAFLFVRMELHSGGVQRFHVEAAGFVFVALSLISRELSPWHAAARRRSTERLGLTVALAGIALALGIYGPALHVGFLSDDWVLLDRVSSGRFGAVSDALFRPVPLLLWAIALKAGGGAVTLHTLNVVIHGLNAFLVSRVVAGWIVDDALVSGAAGLLFLVTPLAVEPVAWCSGVFDLSTMLFCLWALLTARQADHSRFAFAVTLVCAALAILCKESAVVLPGLLLLDVAIRRTLGRRQAALIVIVGLLGVVYAAIRLLLAFGAARPPLSKYVTQRALFNTFGALALPFPSSVSAIWLTVGGMIVLVLTAYLLLLNRDVDHVLPILLGVWCVVCIVPVYPIVFISRDLEGSRYLYESMAGWAALLSVAALLGPRIGRAAGMSMVCVLLTINIVGGREQLHAWTSAAELRDHVERAARENDAMHQCQSVAVSDLPDSVSGAYVLRNGGTELLKGVGVTVGNPASGCRFTWSPTHEAFVRSD